MGPSSTGSLLSMARGLWYTVAGSGSMMTVSTCSGYTNFGTTIYVLSGDSCDSLLSCVSGAVRVDCEDMNGYVVSWFGEEDVLYKIFVSGRELSDIGSFQLSILDQ